MTSTIKVDNIQDQDGNNIINENANTITIGASGDTVTLASGASQTGFGRTGTVDWQTGSIKTATFTAASGEGYFANTSGGAFTMNLPAGTAGNIVAVVDYTNTFQTNNLTIAPNGAQKIGGVASSNVLSTKGQSVTFVYVDDTEGWKNVQDSTSNEIGNIFITATGGTITTSGNCKIHTFTGPGTFCVSGGGTAAPCSGSGSNVVDYLVVAGAGGGGSDNGGGGGAGAAGTPNDAGGIGKAYTIADGTTPVYYAGGGGSSGSPGSAVNTAAAAQGGGGDGRGGVPTGTNTAGQDGTGGGGAGGQSGPQAGTDGGTGIVIIRYLT